ncbi:MarR family winged helix-turn-helix transcriptional regulator [Paraburkholderia silvatlantica]|uniref:MarR family winged helix-turn-helix transcriptional regulator n=1 Tax=Paraburkholderia silvatlantica TaxID=321895 RepID=UPI00105D7CE3|nr:MarR family transcriptional regulator [Paraburkholderia silvatlantica]TDQ89786.1 MarR family transcriptional regulator [Paraburkholderia silvatlantica]
MSDGPFVPAGLGVEPSLGYFLSTARNVLAGRIDRAVAPLGLTSSQIGVILLLWFERASTPNEMSRALSYDTGSMTRMLDRLEKKGFLERQRSQADRRVVELALTDQGRTAAQQLPDLIAAEMSGQLRGFSPEEVATLVHLLQRFIANDGSTTSLCGSMEGAGKGAEAPAQEDGD